MSEINPNSRLEAFCDGVFAIAITLLIIDIKIPSSEKIENADDLWLAMRHIVPSISAFILSFIIILITWVNHHASLKHIHKSSSAFIYANGFMLLTVVFIPFPTSMLGEYILTNHASPAVILYNVTLAVQAISWIFFTQSALLGKLWKNENSLHVITTNRKFGFFAFTLYTLLSIFAIWFPFTIAIITTLTWIFWLIHGIRIKQD